MLKDELAHLVNRPDAVQIAFPLRIAPGEKPVTAQQRSVTTGIVSDRALQLQRQFKARPLPGQPDEVTPEFFVKLFELLFAIGARRNCNRRVGMQMIYMCKRHECMQDRKSTRL